MPLIDARKLISSLLACTCLLWTSGCYTATQITPTDEYQGKTITVKTKDGFEYKLSEWKLLPNGGIEGKGRQILGGFPKYEISYKGTIASDNISMVTYDKFNTVTVICWTLSLMLLTGVALLKAWLQ